MRTPYMNPSLHINRSIDTCELLHSKIQTNGKLKKKKMFNSTILYLGQSILECTK